MNWYIFWAVIIGGVFKFGDPAFAVMLTYTVVMLFWARFLWRWFGLAAPDLTWAEWFAATSGGE